MSSLLAPSHRAVAPLVAITAVIAITLVSPPTASARTSPARGSSRTAPTAGAGSPLWTARYDDATTGDDWANAVAVSPDGSRVFVTGHADRFAGYTTVAFDAASGRRLWVTSSAFSGGGASANAIAVSPDGSKVFVTGTAQMDPFGKGAIGTAAYDATTGAQLWAVADAGREWATTQSNALAVSRDGATVLVGGTASASGQPPRFVTLAYGAVSGTPRWRSLFGSAAKSGDSIVAVALSRDGSMLFATGTDVTPLTGGFQRIGTATVAYRVATGTLMWSKLHFSGTSTATGHEEEPRAVAVSPDGATVYVTGIGTGATGAGGFVTVAYAATTGARRWTARYLAQQSSGGEAITAPDGSRVYVVGTSSENGSFEDAVTIAYDARRGGVIWIRRNPGPAGGVYSTVGAAVTHDGSDVVDAFSHVGFTIAYATNGTRLWSWTAPDIDGGTVTEGFVLGPDGSTAYLAGVSNGPTGTHDMIVVALRVT